MTKIQKEKAGMRFDLVLHVDKVILKPLKTTSHTCHYSLSFLFPTSQLFLSLITVVKSSKRKHTGEEVDQGKTTAHTDVVMKGEIKKTRNVEKKTVPHDHIGNEFPTVFNLR